MPWWTCFNCINLRNTEDRIVCLDFSHHSLHDVPPDIFQYERTLEELHLNSNRITDLPRPLFYCQELKILHLNDNDINAIPPAISSLSNLENINLSRNSLTTLVDNMKQCKHLLTLDVSVNSLERLPDVITSLISLQELYLNDTFLEFLPANFGRLINLRILELRDNNLITLPKSMARLQNLQRIDIGHNEFTELPEVIGQLVNLTELWIDNNRIRRISSNVGNLRKLIHFEASNNLLTHLPNEISNWAKCEEMSLTGNELENLPFSIGMMKCLVKLKADENQLQELPESICQLDCLEELMVSHNDLFRLPPSIGLLRKIRFLTADENLIRHLPNELCSCTALTLLSVRGNKLTDMPINIGHLHNLRVINVVNNFITHLPVSLLGLSQLAALWISDNQSQPLMPLQKEYGPEQSVHLTCFMLPQTTSNVNNADQQIDREPPYQIPPKLSADAMTEQPSRRICFASDPVVSIEQTGRLMRSPTPYPKELRVLAKYAKNIQKTGAGDYIACGSSDYAQIDEILETKKTESIDPKEARLTANSSLMLNPSALLAIDDDEEDVDIVTKQRRNFNGNHDENDAEIIEQQPLLSQNGTTVHYQPNAYQKDLYAKPFLLNNGQDEIDSNPSCFYATVDKKQSHNIQPIVPPQQLIDYENLSICSTSASNHYGYKNGDGLLVTTDDGIRMNKYENVQFNPNGDNVENMAGIRMSQASSFGDESIFSYSQRSTSHYPIDGNNENGQFYVQQQPQFYNNNQQLYENSLPQPQHNGFGLHHETNVPNHLALYNSVAPEVIYNNEQNDSIYYAPPTDQRIQPPIRQPPPYHIAKAFTKKSEKDLMIYDSYRNKKNLYENGLNDHQLQQLTENGETNVDDDLDEDNVNDYDDDDREYHDNLKNATISSIDLVDKNLNLSFQQQQQQQQQQQSANNGDDNASIMSGTSTTTSNLRNSSSMSNSKSTPWLFGLHKNPKVMQVRVPKSSPDLGFKVAELQHEKGIYISEISINSTAAGLLQKNDKVLDIDGIDCTKIPIKEALTVLSNSGPIINIMVSRI